MNQLVDRGRLAGNDSLHGLDHLSHQTFAAYRVRHSLTRDPDHRDSWIVGTSIVSAIAEIAEPHFQSWAVVLPDFFFVRLHLGLAGDRRPFTRAIEEAEVDIWTMLQIVCLPRLVVCVEDEVDVVVFLYISSE